MRFVKDNDFTQEQFAKLLSEYRQKGSIEARNALIMAYAYIPQTVAIQLRGLADGYAQVDDMVNQGIITLIDCFNRFDTEKGIAFEYYAFMRVKGGIIDLVRKQDWVPRRVRELEKNINIARNELSQKLGVEPTYEEIAEELNIPVAKLHEVSQEISNSESFSLEEFIQNMSQMGTSLEEEGLAPDKQLLRSELSSVLAEAIENLTERERLIVTLYYYENLTLTEISEVLEISVQRVSQINARAVSKLKEALKEYVQD